MERKESGDVFERCLTGDPKLLCTAKVLAYVRRSRIKGGSRYQICEELSRKYSSEMADQYRKVTRLAEKAAYSSHAMEEKQAEEVRVFLMSTQKQILNEKNLFQKWKMQLKSSPETPDRISGRSQRHKRISRAGNCLTFPANQLIIRIL